MAKSISRALQAALIATAFIRFHGDAQAQGAPNAIWYGAGHATVQAVALSPDGSTLATASLEDDTIKLWDTASGSFVRTLAASYTGLYALAFTPDGQFLVSGGDTAFGSGQSDVLMWRVSDGQIVQQFTANSLAVFSIAISPDGQLLAGGDSNGMAWIWQISTGRCCIR
jgi:WD40 repeat protein